MSMVLMVCLRGGGIEQAKAPAAFGKHLSSVLIVPAVALNSGHKKTSGALASGGFLKPAGW
jgi:hypothetical protein